MQATAEVRDAQQHAREQEELRIHRPDITVLVWTGKIIVGAFALYGFAAWPDHHWVLHRETVAYGPVVWIVVAVWVLTLIARDADRSHATPLGKLWRRLCWAEKGNRGCGR